MTALPNPLLAGFKIGVTPATTSDFALLMSITRDDIPARYIPFQTFRVDGFSNAGDHGQGALYKKGTSGGPMAIQDASGQWFELVITGRIPAGWYGVTADSATNDTAALKLFFGANGPKHGYLGPGNYIINEWIRVTGTYRLIEGPSTATIKMKPADTGDGTIQWVQPALVIDAASHGVVLDGFSVDHRGQDWVAYPASNFRPDFLTSTSGDVRGCAILAMGDECYIHNVNVYNGWDNCLGIGRYDEVTGTQSVAPNNVRVDSCRTFNGGCGAHAHGGAPSDVYYQGAGIDVLTGSNVTVVGCHDFASRDGFWADISGGNSATFVACVAHNTAAGLIWSDAVSGGNQSWNTGGFGGSITGTNAGWRKTPGGLAFYSGSPNTRFIGCSAVNPALYGFVTDYPSRGCLLNDCTVINAGMAAFVFAGKDHQCVSPVVQGAWKRTGEVAASGSVCPNGGAIQIVGMREVSTSTNVDASVEIWAPTINGGVAYATGSPAAPTYSHAIECVANQSRPAVARVHGGTIADGVTGRYLIAAGCNIFEAGSRASDGMPLFGPGATEGEPSYTQGQALVVRRNMTASDWAAIAIIGGTTGHSTLALGDKDADLRGGMVYDHATDILRIYAGGAARLLLNGTTPSVTGSRGGNAALASLLTTLAGFGLITDTTSA